METQKLKTQNRKPQKRSANTHILVFSAVLTALVVVLAYISANVKFGPFSITLTLIPIVIGSAVCGSAIGAWLGLAMGVMVLLSGDAAAFLSVNFWGTVVTVLAKGAACGFAAGVVYRALRKYNITLAVVAAAVVCPLVNTGVFLLGCQLFFMPTITAWAGGSDAWVYILGSMIGVNFLVEFAINLLFSPAITRILLIRRKA